MRRRFSSNQSGAVAVVVGICAVMLMLFVGVAIDSTRAYYVKDVLQKSLDAGALAAGHSIDPLYLEADAREFFDANFANVGTTATLTNFSVSVSTDADGVETIALSADANMPTTFMALGGFESLNIAAKTDVVRETRSMELIMVLDNTFSMRSGGKIDAMKDAANDLIGIIFGDQDVHPYLWVGLAPFVAAVDIGPQHTDWLTSAGQTVLSDGNYFPTEWKGCVRARDAGEDVTDTTPISMPFAPLYYDDDSKNDWVIDANLWLARDSDCCDVRDTGTKSGQGPNRFCGPALTSMTPKKSTILNAISTMKPWFRGGTTANLGLVWGWRMISPKWRGLWDGDTPANLPMDYDDPTVKKVIIVLTDGMNQLWGDDITAYGRRADAGFSSWQEAHDFLDTQTTTVCDSLKVNGVEIFAITFGSDIDTETQDLFRDCASIASYYFHAPTNAELGTVFRVIASELQALRISR